MDSESIFSSRWILVARRSRLGTPLRYTGIVLTSFPANDGTTVLISGAKYPEIVKFLAEKMPNVNGVDKDGNSVMHLCAETADEETIRKLLYYSAKEDLPNKKGETPILFAARAGNVDMVKRLLAMNVKVTQKIVDEAKTQEIRDLLSAKLKK